MSGFSLGAFKVESESLADEFATKGTLKHYMLRKGFLPHNEEQAEQMMDSIIEEKERLTEEIERLKSESRRLEAENRRRKFSEFGF